jgi:hypothetical protein
MTFRQSDTNQKNTIEVAKKLHQEYVNEMAELEKRRTIQYQA